MSGLEAIVEGLVVEHPYGRTVEQSDNLFATLTALNTAQAHFNLPGALGHLDGRFTERLVVGSLVLALAMGLGSSGWPGASVDGELGVSNLRFPNPTFPGDTLHVRSRVLGVEPDGEGLAVDSAVQMRKQGDVVVLEARRRLRLVGAR